MPVLWIWLLGDAHLRLPWPSDPGIILEHSGFLCLGFILVFPSGVCLESQLLAQHSNATAAYCVPEAASPVSVRARVQQTGWVLWLSVLRAQC